MPSDKRRLFSEERALMNRTYIGTLGVVFGVSFFMMIVLSVWPDNWLYGIMVCALISVLVLTKNIQRVSAIPDNELQPIFRLMVLRLKWVNLTLLIATIILTCLSIVRA